MLLHVPPSSAHFKPSPVHFEPYPVYFVYVDFRLSIQNILNSIQDLNFSILNQMLVHVKLVILNKFRSIFNQLLLQVEQCSNNLKP